MIRAIAVSILALGFAGTALADRDHGRNDRHDRDRYERRHDHDRHDRDSRNYRYERPRGYYYAPPPPPRYERRWRAPPPRNWYPGWREPYGRGGYRYWNNDYYYVVPAPPSLGISLTLPLR